MKVLVAYASRHGATQGIAEAIAATLERHGMRVTLRPVANVGNPEGYDAYVLGSAAYMGGWMSEATMFVRRNREHLATRPVWLFSSGPINAGPLDDKGRDVVVASIPKEFAEFEPLLHPRDEHVFFGAYDPDQAAIGLAERMMSGFMRLLPVSRASLPIGDFRDWGAIEAWAESIAASLAETRELSPA